MANVGAVMVLPIVVKVIEIGEWFVVEVEVEGVLDMGCEEFGMGGG